MMLYVGTAGWSYKDWEGVVYPKPPPRGFDPLRYLSQFFNCVEVNMSFYRPPVAKTVSGWIKKVHANNEFTFSVKLWKRFTHERKERWTESEVEIFEKGIAPLVSESSRNDGADDLCDLELFASDACEEDRSHGFRRGMLGALLMQFPWSFRKTEENCRYLATLSETFAGYPKVVEVRHASWDTSDALEFMRQRNLNFCNIDQPRMRDCVGETTHVTGDIAYVRLHGRNYENWFSRNADSGARYDYLYSEKELSQWAERIKNLMRRAGNVFVITNNHPAGKGVANALQIKAMLTGKKVVVPESLVKSYPFLKDYAQ